MTTWRDSILECFTPEIAAANPLTLVADPDELLSEAGMVEAIRAGGFTIVVFEDHAAFRYMFERRSRSAHKDVHAASLVVVVRGGREMIDELPYDLLDAARQEHRVLSFSIGDLFPNLAPQTVAELERSDLDAVHRGLVAYRPDPLGPTDTRNFLLRHVFEVAPELIKEPAHLLRVLLRKHYSARLSPPAFDQHLVGLLRKSKQWDEWPLEQIVANRASFLQFLQERWLPFVRRELAARTDCAAEIEEPYGLKIPGPLNLPFNHDDIRVYVDNLFLEGLLTPTDQVAQADVSGCWMVVGVVGDQVSDRQQKISRLLDLISREFPNDSKDHAQWLQTAERWAEAIALRMALDGADAALQARFEDTHEKIETAFQAWMEQHYSLLATLSPLRPVMVHHLPAFLASRAVGRKQALLVVDGLSLDEWHALRRTLRPAWAIDEGALFAWVPTLTSVSRQSIFKGEPPRSFEPTINSTHKEPKHWERFWEGRKLGRSEVAYLCQKDSEDDDAFLSRVREQAEAPKCRVLGIVVGTVDKMLHGTVTGTDGLHAQLRHWAQRGALHKALTLLADNDYDVVLTSDHGNVEGVGIGKPNVGVTAEQRGERAHIFSDERTRANVSAKYPESIEWLPVGLPDNYYPLLAPERRAFIHKGKRAVSHGGLCIEEVIVPFVQIARAP